MGADTTTDPKFEIGHVLFIDIVGYSKLLIGEQSELVRELNEVVATSEQVRVVEEQGRLVSLPTGDGVALVFRDSAEAFTRRAARSRARTSLSTISRRATAAREGPVVRTSSSARCTHKPRSLPGTRLTCELTNRPEEAAPAQTFFLCQARSHKNPQCLDILVTQDGTKNGIVVGWITNVMVLNAATI